MIKKFSIVIAALIGIWFWYNLDTNHCIYLTSDSSWFDARCFGKHEHSLNFWFFKRRGV